MNNKKRIACFVTLITAMLSGSAALALEAPPIIAGDGNVDIRYPFVWSPHIPTFQMEYDAARERVVLFGGTNECVCPTMEWDGNYWKGVWTTNVPPVTTCFTMAYDAERRVMVVVACARTTLETWLYDGTNWTQATPAVTPPYRIGYSMAFDSVGRRILLYGGWDGDLIYRDLWAWDGVNWTELGGVPADMPMGMGVAGCDENRGVVVFAGGYTNGWKLYSGTGLRWTPISCPSTWEWNGTTWSNRNLAMYGAKWTYDGDRKCLVYYSPSEGLYVYNGVSKVLTNNTRNLPAAIAYDAARHSLVMHKNGSSGGNNYLSVPYTYLLQGTNLLASSALCPGNVYGSAVPPILFRDFNGDGRPDLLMPVMILNTLQGQGLYTNGPAGFDNRPAWWATNVNNTSAALGDMNGDGRPDLAVDNFVFAGGSNGLPESAPCWTQQVVTKTIGTIYSTSVYTSWWGVAWVDVNRDGRTDLAGFGGKNMRNTNVASWLCSFANTGTMLADNPSTNLVFTNMWVRYADWADVNQDGFADLAVSLQSYTNSLSDMRCVYTNNGAGGFSLAQTLTLEYLGSGGAQFRFADLNGDWWPDLVAPGKVFTNHLGSFSPVAWNPSLTSSYMDIGDVDGDGDPDMVFYDVTLPGSDGQQYVAYDAVLYRNDAGTLTDLPVWSAKATSFATMDRATLGGALADVNGDGTLDVATGSGIFLLKAPWQTPSYDESLPAPLWLRSRINPADHTSTLVEWDPVQSTEVAGYRLYGKFHVEKGIRGSPPMYYFDRYVQIAELPATQTQFVVTRDLIADVSGWNAAPFYDPDPWDHPDEMDCDGHQELWGVDAAVYVATVDKAGREYGYSIAGACSIEAANSVFDRTTDFWGAGSQNVVADMNGDGSLDLVGWLSAGHPMPAYNYMTMVIYTNDGHGSFSLARECREGDPGYVPSPGWLQYGDSGSVMNQSACCDLNGDGRTDLLVKQSSILVNTNTGLPETRWSLSVYTNTWPARIGFAADTNWSILMPAGAIGATPTSPIFGDANGDGRQDLVVSAPYPNNRAYLFLNEGNGRLSSVPAWTSPCPLVCAAFGDLDHDGKADLAACTNTSSVTSAAPAYCMGAVIYRGSSTGLTETPVWSDLQGSLAGKPVAITWADFDGDGWQDLTVHGEERKKKVSAYPAKECLNHPTVLYKNNAGSLAYLCVYKARDYKDGAGVGIGGGSFTCGWADLNHDGRPDLWGTDLILEAADSRFNAGPIGIQPTYWHGNADEEGLGYQPPFKGIQGVYDFNGDGTPDFLFGGGTIQLRTPNSIYQADYVEFVFELGGTQTNVFNSISGRLDIYPSGTLVLDGVGATQAISVVYVQPNMTAVPLAYTDANLSITLSGNSSNDIPYAILNGNVITAVRDGTVTLNVKYGCLIPNAYSSSYLTATKSVRVINAAKPDRLEISPIKYTLERIGETVTLSVARRNSESGLFQDVTARSMWQSSDTGVITMTGQVAIARGIGVAEVVATCDGLSGTSRVTVAASAGLAGLTLYPQEASVRVGETRGFEVRARFTDGTVQPVTFAGALASSAPGVAAVDGLRVLGVSPGFAQVTATYLGQTATALVAVDAAATNAPAEPPLCEILGLQHQGGNVAMDWYCTPPAGPYTPFSVLTSTNLQTGPWTPIQTPVPRHPSGYHSWTYATNGAPAMFYRITSP
ncbi:MAG: VCBS repeat-containing protein [bacterium]